MTDTPTDPTAIRAALIDALRADLIGPYDFDAPETATEVLELGPSRWYLTGFLACEGDRLNDDPDADDDGGAGDDTDEGGAAAPEAAEQTHQKRFYPASVGLSVLLPPGPADGSGDALTVDVRFAEYARIDGTDQALDLGSTDEGKPKRGQQWKRKPYAETLSVPLDAAALARGVRVPRGGGLEVQGRLEVWQGRPGLPDGVRSLSLFLVNKRRVIEDKGRRDEGWVFQVRMALRPPAGMAFVSRPDLRAAASVDRDDRIAEVQFRAVKRFAVGHGIGVEQAADGRWVATRWLPEGVVEPVRTRAVGAVSTGMEALAGLSDGAALKAALMPVVAHYRAWIAAQRSVPLGADHGGRRAATRDDLLFDAEVAARRIESGIERLVADETARQAFCWMNAAMAAAARQRSPERYADGGVPAWRLFQLAFVLLNVDGIAGEGHEDREIVELIFFPTGGGKTEAYLGVIGFTLLLRRMHGQSRDDGGLGVAVVLRYTLRLLTLDQLGRAATLICALERVRRKRPKRLGDARFAIGLWVGRSATANTMGQVKKAITEYSSGRGQLPLPLPTCPWCKAAFKKTSLQLEPRGARSPTRVGVYCPGTRCDFNGRNGGVPVLFVDEQIYRELPCFVLATVDKFAMLPWRGETAALFGRVHSRGDDGFYGPMDSVAPRGKHTPLPEGLAPPELIVQDEVHLISGPLGTMTGLYETAIDRLSQWHTVGGDGRRPKIVASTATARRAQAQMQALFGRGETRVFPPPGVDDGESFFAERDPDTPDRRYLGVAAAGRAFKAVQLRVYVSLLTAAQKLAAECAARGEPGAADAYMTVLGYFNSLRELGGMRRLAEDEVRSRSRTAGERRPLDKRDGPHRWLAKRDIRTDPVELTSREKTGQIAKTKDRLGVAHGDKGAVDVALATNMISVGLDIDRLGLMVVSGQPKTTAEYIQASSRVGRQARRRPGLVVTCLNLHRPRDRSHYEDFPAYHAAFYRRVEANSLTPFSKPALDRGLAGLLVALVRLVDPALTPPAGAEALAHDRATAEAMVEAIVERAKRATASVDPDAEQAMVDDLRQRLTRLVDDWATLMVEAKTEEAGTRCYSKLDRGRNGKPLLLPKLDAASKALLKPAEQRFTAPMSMRDVEPSVHIWVNKRRDAETQRKSAARSRPEPEGRIRRSQMLTTYGPGALVDLLDYAVIITGLRGWEFSRKIEVTHEPRLRDKLARRLQDSGQALSVEDAFRLPPAGDDDDPHPLRGVRARIFPTWFVCQRCRALTRAGSLQEKGGRFIHECTARGGECVPVRFVQACESGHIDDVNWIGVAHRGKPCESPTLALDEGVSGDFSEVRVICRTCNASRSLTDLKLPDMKPACRGARPWMGRDAAEDCPRKATLIVRTASSAYFSQTDSALAIPDADNAVDDAVADVWDALAVANASLLPAFRQIPKVQAAVGDFSDAEVLAAVERLRAGKKPERVPIRLAEFRTFMAAPDETPGEIAPESAQFFARRARVGPIEGVERVVLAHALREVRCQVGFTRLGFPGPSLAGDPGPAVNSAPLGRETDWLPAVEVRGEGVFIALDPARLAAWEARPKVIERAEELQRAFEAQFADRDEPPPFFGARAYLLHSLSHLLITAVSLECGYSASAIRERIYCSPPGAEAPVAAILLATATPGTEGTLGGLVAQGRRLGEHLEAARRQGTLCSNDPVCASHDPNGPDERRLEGAACHGCLFIAESSCEWFNHYLDRALVVPVLGKDPSLAFFG